MSIAPRLCRAAILLILVALAGGARAESYSFGVLSQRSAVLTAQFTNQEQTQMNGMPRARDLRQNGMVRPVIAPVQHRRAPEGI